MRLHFPASLALALAAATSFAQSAQDKSVILSEVEGPAFLVAQSAPTKTPRTVLLSEAKNPDTARSAKAASSFQPQPPALIPQPASITTGSTTLTLRTGDAIAYDAKDADAAFDAHYLADLLNRTHGLTLRTTTDASRARIVLHHTEASSANAESYAVRTASNQLLLEASTPGGLFYATVTAWQLFTSDARRLGPSTIPAVTIDDAPAMPYRGIMLDSARHMQPIAFIHQFVDWMSLHKLNTLHWHLTEDQGWRIEIKRYPKLTTIGAHRTIASQIGKLDPKTHKQIMYGGFYTQAQIRELVAYAAHRNVTIVPEIEMPGHASAVLAAYPELAAGPAPTEPVHQYGIFPNLFAPSEASFTFLQNVLLEVMDLFPSHYIHIGGDEAIKPYWHASPAIQAQMKQLNIKTEDELQAWFIKRIDTFVTAHGRTTLGWDEILEGGLAPGATVMSWRGMTGGIEAARQGHDAILTPARPLYLNYRQTDQPHEGGGRSALNTLENVYNFETSPSELTPEQQKHLIGVQGSLWTEYVITPDRVQWMTFPRASALAELGWLPPAKRNWPSFVSRMPAQIHRYATLGINASTAAYRVNLATEQTGATQARITLNTQTAIAPIHYTLDGTAPTENSPTYTEPLETKLPVRLRAFAVPGTELDQAITPAFIATKYSQQMQLCAFDPSIQMESDPPIPGRPAVLTNWKNPCWIYKSARLDNVKSVRAGVLQIPYVSSTPGQAPPPTGTAHTPYGELEVHQDTCDGKLLTALPLEPAHATRNLTYLEAPLPATTGTHDLCLRVVRPHLQPLWMLDSFQIK